MNLSVEKSIKQVQRYPVNDNLKEAKKNAAKFAKIIKKYNFNDKPVVLFARGSSGIIIATYICNKLACDMRVVRKAKSHGNPNSEIRVHSSNFNVIVDDFISTGNTIVSIIDELDSFTPIDLCIVTGYCYTSLEKISSTKKLKHLIVGETNFKEGFSDNVNLVTL